MGCSEQSLNSGQFEEVLSRSCVELLLNYQANLKPFDLYTNNFISLERKNYVECLGYSISDNSRLDFRRSLARLRPERGLIFWNAAGNLGTL